jgi:hypothetical protein
VCFLLLVLRPNKWHKSECFERARLQPRRKPAFNERALAAEVDRSIRKTEPVSYSVKFRDTTLGMVGKNHLARRFARDSQRPRQKRLDLGPFMLRHKKKNSLLRIPGAHQILIVQKNVRRVPIG